MNKNYKWLLLIAVSLMAFIINVDYTAVNLALIPMAHELHVDIQKIQWVLSAYIFIWAILAIPVGYLIDGYNKKRMALSGLFLFLLASILAGSAQSANLLIAARLLQGVAAAMYIPTVYALIYLYFKESERGRAMGLMSLGVGLGLAIGPFIGGLLLSLTSWRSIFWVNIPIASLAFYIIYLSHRDETMNKSHVQALHKTSVLLVSAVMLLVLYICQEWQMWAVHLELSMILCVSALTLAALFVYLQFKVAHPLVPRSLLSNRPYLGVIFGIFLEQYGFSCIMVATGLFFQEVLLLSVFHSSLLYLFLTIIFALLSSLAGPWVDRIGLRMPSVTGLIIFALGCLLFGMVQQENVWMTGLFCFILGSGMGLAFAGLNTGIVKTVPPEQMGIASSLFLCLALLGNAFSVMITTFIYENLGLTKLLRDLTSQQINLNALQIQDLRNYIAHLGEAGISLPSLNASLQDRIFELLPHALGYGVQWAMLLGAALLGFGAILCLFLLKDKTK